MLESLKITLGAGGAIFDLTQRALGAQALFQRVAANMASRRGSDPVWADKGTDFERRLITGLVSGVQRSQPMAQFAALDTKVFVNETTQDPDARILSLTVTPVVHSGADVEVSYDVVLANGQNVVATRSV